MPLDPTPVPNELRGMRIALLISGGIAAYKVVDLASALTQAGARVRVAMTSSAMRFVGPPTFQGVTGNPVATGMWAADGSPEPHVFLGDWAQVILVAPAAADRGARVTLVTTASHPEHHGIDVQRVDTAEEMLAELRSQLRGADLLLMAAAVGDFKPARTAGHKIRREETPSLNLALEPIPDLVATLARDPELNMVFRVGFAAEDSKLDAKAIEKMKRKGLQAIVANDISRRDIGFGSEYNAGVLLFADGSRHELEKATKREMSEKILDLVLPHLKR